MRMQPTYGHEVGHRRSHLQPHVAESIVHHCDISKKLFTNSLSAVLVNVGICELGVEQMGLEELPPAHSSGSSRTAAVHS